jgi:ABC-type nickel/cobalt efflux system permease component RcnA
MVAAYLLGTRGRIRDALVLGAVTTVTHTGGVFLFGLCLFALIRISTGASEGALQGTILMAAEIASGVLLFALGALLFFRRWPAGAASESHHHGHSHGHSHGHTAHRHASPRPRAGLPAGAMTASPATPAEANSEREHLATHAHEQRHGAADGGPAQHSHGPRLSELVTLGISGGLVPCPAGLTVVLVALRFPDKLLFALLLLFFFSLGLGVVLVAVGVLLITGRALTAERMRDGAFFQEIRFLRRALPRSTLLTLDAAASQLGRWLPALSSLFIAGLGVYFLASAL